MGRDDFIPRSSLPILGVVVEGGDSLHGSCGAPSCLWACFGRFHSLDPDAADQEGQGEEGVEETIRSTRQFRAATLAGECGRETGSGLRLEQEEAGDLPPLPPPKPSDGWPVAKPRSLLRCAPA
jgi:hypothetical protein